MENINGKITYEELRQVIFDYFKKTKGIELGSISIDYLKGKLMGNNDSRNFFYIKNEIGNMSFDLSKEEIQKIFNSYLESENYELTDLEYGYNVNFKCCEKTSTIEEKKEDEIDLSLNGKITYKELRQVIFDYYKEKKGVELSSTSIDYLKSKLKDDANTQPFFIMHNKFGDTRFDLSKDEIQKIFSSYLESKNYELSDLNFDYEVNFKCKPKNKEIVKENEFSHHAVINKEVKDLDKQNDDELSITKESNKLTDTNKANKKIIYEAVLLHNAFNNSLAGLSDNEYSMYHCQNADNYRLLGNHLNTILGYNGQAVDEFINYVSNINLTPEQKKSLVKFRREPMFKKLMGENAMQQKSELENVLGTKITSEGMTFADEHGLMVATKTEAQLEQELNTYNDKLARLLTSGVIADEQYESYVQNLDYIYDYYISCSRGEQIPFRKMTNAQYENLEKRAFENGVDFHEQLIQETTTLMDNHEELQELQSQYEGRKR